MRAHQHSAALSDGVFAVVLAGGHFRWGRNHLRDRCGRSLLFLFGGGALSGFSIGSILGGGVELRGSGVLSLLFGLSSILFGRFLSERSIDGSFLVSSS